MEVVGFVKPRKFTKIHITTSGPSLVEFKNKYGALEDLTEATTSIEQISSIPPLYIYGIENKCNFGKHLSKVCSQKLNIQHSKDYIKFHFKTKADYDKIYTYCMQQNIQFATQTPKKDRSL